MKIGITQPTFLPWAGYFGLIDFVDEIVFLDNVQFEKRSWQSRNKIKFLNNELLLTVPVSVKNKRFQMIKDVRIDIDSNYIKKHLATLNQAYSKAKYFDNYYPELSRIYNLNFKYLLDLNISLINFFLKSFFIEKKFSFSSALNTTKKRGELIFEICKKKKATNYISTIGSKVYLENTNNEKLKVSYYEFSNFKYDQLGNNFFEFLSVIDLLFNIGPNSSKYIKNNFRII